MQTDKTTKELLKETEKLKFENNKLQQELELALISIEAIKTEKIDALVIPTKNEIKVFTEKTADRTYRILIEKMHEGAITINKEGIILYSNSCFANMVNSNLKKVIGAEIINFIEDKSKEHFTSIFLNGWKTALKEEINIITSDNTCLTVLISLNALTLEDSVVMSIIFTDLTILHQNQKNLELRTHQLEKKNSQLEVALQELNYQNEERSKRTVELAAANLELISQNADKEKRAEELEIVTTDAKEQGELNLHKERIIATLSHDLRTPLAGIISLSEHLKDRFESMEKPKIKEMLELLYKASTNELRMLDSLVEWARVKYASEVFEPVNIELYKSVNKVFKSLKENAVEKGIYLSNEVREDINVFADARMLFSIFQNIISNSIKNSIDHGKITISATMNDNKITVKINDMGVGMSQETINKLFSPQLKSLSKEREENKGAGIGLLLVKGFLEKNGGEIWVESAEGIGSSFYFTLPAFKPLDISSN